MARSPQTTSLTIPEQNVFAHLQLRSATPAANEKVLEFLERMAPFHDDELENTPPRSLVGADEYVKQPESGWKGTRSPTAPIYSPAPRSKASDTLLNTGLAGMFSPRKDLKSNIVLEDTRGGDVESNVQDGVRSEFADMNLHEPGPDDPPGPKYASYDSGPSFGNFGPLPPDDHVAAANPYVTWNPVWSEIINSKPNGPNGTEHGGTPRQTTANIDGDSGTRAKSPERLLTTSPRAQSRAQSRAASNRGEQDHRLLSPQSGRSKLTKATEKSSPYPPLPESKLGDEIYTNGPGPSSPNKSRVRSKAPSISPSDSPSQMVSKPPHANGNGTRSPPLGSVLSAGGGNPQNRPFSPYRHAPTEEDLLNAAVRGRALVIPQGHEIEPSGHLNSPSKLQSSHSRVLSQMENGKAGSNVSAGKQPSAALAANHRNPSERERTPTRALSPDVLDAEEARIVNDALAARTPRTSYYGGSIQADDTEHYHDVELCQLLQEEKHNQHEIVKKALRKAIRQRIKKLGMKYDPESIKQYKKAHHDHDPVAHLNNDEYEEPPKWAADLKREMVLMQQRIESLGPKIENLKGHDLSFNGEGSRFAYGPDESTRTPMTQTVNIQTQPTGTMADSMYQHPETEILLDDDGNVRDIDDMTETQGHHQQTDGETRSLVRSAYTSEQARDDSPGHQVLEEELFKLRQRPAGSQSALSHRSWELAHHIEDDPDDTGDRSSRPLPELPTDANDNTEMAVQQQGWSPVDYGPDEGQLPPWQRIHARLLSWAIVWPMSELENALNSTTRGQQVDEVALSIWSTQTYKRYVRTKLTDSPQGVVDRLFVPPNIADAINNAVFNGRHGSACGMLKDLWLPFGLEGMPRLIVVLAKHRSDPNHWVVHRFSLPEGGLTTYDSYPERTLPDGRPLGWWFAIRVAWPNATYPSPDKLVQKMVRLHRPLQLAIDNSVAAAGIWRNVLMGSRAERSLDLERLRDLINTEVKNLKQRKQLGKLTIGGSRPPWDDMN